MKAAGVNPLDNYIASGTYPQTPPFPFTAGCDGAGIVEAVDTNATKFKVDANALEIVCIVNCIQFNEKV